VSENWSFADQHGEEIRLKRFYGQVVMIDVAAEWCGPCRQAAQTLPEEYGSRADGGFVALQLLIDGLGFGDGQPNVQRWVDEFDLTIPVLDDGAGAVYGHYLLSGSIPTFTILGRDLTIEALDSAGFPPPWSIVDGLLAEDGPEIDPTWWPQPDNAAELRAELGFGESEFTGYAEAL
jgi:thiol-disulfide isomerase/thioredoxin